MDLFRKAGEKFEKTKQSIMDSRKSEYVCLSCEEQVVEEYDHCPHCGESPIKPIE